MYSSLYSAATVVVPLSIISSITLKKIHDSK
jgi:hypothetical protein